jgi:hypothetical protein
MTVRAQCVDRALYRRAILVVVLAAGLPVPAVADPAPVGAGAPVGDVTLRYQAFVAGAPVGEATVKVAVAEGHYRVEGDARSNGWLKGFSKWRNRFAAHGRLDGLTREPAEFSYIERDRDKQRQVLVRDGMLQVTKSGKARTPRASPAGPDLVSVLFVQPHCQGDQRLHTGRHVYQLSRLRRDPGGCRYAVVDEDGDGFEIELVFGRRGDLVVPTRVTVYAWLTGWVELLEP